MERRCAIAVHGGAGTILRSRMTPEKEARYSRALEAAVSAGKKVLEAGGSSLDAVTAAVCVMEDDPLFNAGRGSVFTAGGGHEMDASIMDGRDLSAGAVCGVSGIANPVVLARKVMTDTEFVMLSGEGALDFARKAGFEIKRDEYFFNQFRYDQWLEVRDTDETRLDHSVRDGGKPYKMGTVGAVAVDRDGHVSAATSTGGMTNKNYGRVGDSPLIGCGNYANDRTCAVSCTGNGEFFIRGVVAYDVSCLVEYRGMNLADACHQVVHKRLKAIDGEGGLIAVDPSGKIAMPFNSGGMYRGSWQEGGALSTAIY